MEGLEETELQVRLITGLPLNNSPKKNNGLSTPIRISSNRDKSEDFSVASSNISDAISEQNSAYLENNKSSNQELITYTDSDTCGNDKISENSTCLTLNNNVPDMKSKNYSPSTKSDSSFDHSFNKSMEINNEPSEKKLFISLHDCSLTVRDIALASRSCQDIEFIDAEPDGVLVETKQIQNDADSINQDIDDKLGVKDLLNSLANSIIDGCSLPSEHKMISDTSRTVTIPSSHKIDLKRKLSTSLEAKKNKMIKYLRFATVTFFYFERSQGFSSIPSKGGATLGMSQRHFYITSLSVEEYEHNKCPRYLPRTRSTNILTSQRIEQPKNIEALSTVQRIQLLESCHIVVDPAEEEDCNQIRSSRMAAGCLCRDYCDPDICPCHLDEIKCQVDQPNFPCRCSREHCKNKSGRIEYNNSKVKSHFYKTMRKIKCEGKRNI